MSEVIEFEKVMQLRETDANCRFTENGETWFKYASEYQHERSCGDGSLVTWAIFFWARNDAEAEKMVQAMRLTLGEPWRVTAEVRP